MTTTDQGAILSVKPIFSTLTTLALLATLSPTASAWAAASRNTPPAGAPKGAPTSRLNSAGAKGKLQPKPTSGTLKMPYDAFAVSLLALDGTDMLAIEGKKGLADVPPGKYWVTSWRVFAKDAAGRMWRADGGPAGQPQMAVRITAGETTEFRLATPLAAVLTVDQVGSEFAFLLQFQGTGGDRCSRVFVDGERPTPPRLKVTDADGHPVATLDFKFGCSFLCRQRWQAPEGVKWPLTAVAEVEFGPFPVTSGEPTKLSRPGND